ncbi:hypothetical protein MBLNU230_g7761t1 [Neophaeotheca triangularis]
MDDFAKLHSSISSAVVATTRNASELAAEDLSFYRSLDSGIARSLDAQNARLLDLAQRLAGSATANTETVRPRLRSVEDVEGNWNSVVDVIDSLLERADTALDEFTGAVKRLTPTAEQQAAKSVQPRPSKIANALRNQDLEKPQLLFKHGPENNATDPFVPLLEAKPHSTVPLELKPEPTDDGTQVQYQHPYQQEIEQYSYPPSMYTPSEPIVYHPFDQTTATLVDTEEEMVAMLEELKQAKEIAIDLEHHDQRSYIGIVSLMQISTRDKDWIVDTLRPWRRKLSLLNEVFADPSIIKVLHGAYMDVVWLQRDLGLYLVGLFDTHYACRALGYPGGSLAFLLKKFANVDAQKQYQTADWRIRPLPKELFDYARSDTHFLLYIFDCMRNELIQKSDFTIPNHEKDKINDVLERSRDTALQRYERPIYDTEFGQGPAGWYKMLDRTPALFNKEQFAVFKAVHKWRDDVAREQDDSVHYVMANHNIFSIAKALPATRAELLSVAQPTTQTVRLRADELLAAIQRAKKDAPNGPEMMEVLKKVDPKPRSWAKHQTAQPQSLASYLPKQQPNGVSDGLAASSSLPLRSSSSNFWGNALPSNPQEQTQNRSLSTTVGLSLAVPLPPLSADNFLDASDLPTPLQLPEPGPTQQQLPQQGTEDEADDTFVLKNMPAGNKNKKRKRQSPPPSSKDTTDGMAAQTDEVALDGTPATSSEPADIETKRAAKAARKAAKRARKEQEQEQAPAGEEQPFDYASAPSVLDPRSGESWADRKKREKENKKAGKGAINPFAKSLDAPKGLGRVQKERAGKGGTWR